MVQATLPSGISEANTEQAIERSREVHHRAFSVVALVVSVLTAIGAIAVFVGILHKLRRPLVSDFGDFYSAGRLVDMGRLSADYSLRSLERTEGSLNHGHFLHLVFPYPPYVGAGMGLLAQLPVNAAFMVWTAINIGAFALAGLVALSILPTRLRVIGVLALVGCVPLVISTAQGENSGLLTLGFTLALVALIPDLAPRYVSDPQHRGWIIALAFLILAVKPLFLVVPLLLVCLRRRRIDTIGCSAGLGGALVIGLATGGLSGYENYAALLRQGLHWTTQYHWGPQFNYTIKALLQSFLGFGAATTFLWGVCALALVGLVAVMYLSLRSEEALAAPSWMRRDIQYPGRGAEFLFVAAVASLLLTNHALFHDLALVYPAAIVTLATRLRWAALLFLIAPWLDPGLYGAINMHVVVLACVATVLLGTGLWIRDRQPDRRMVEQLKQDERATVWKLFARPPWGSASG